MATSNGKPSDRNEVVVPDGTFGLSRVGKIRYKQKKRQELLLQMFGLVDMRQLKLVVGRPCLFQDEVACKKRRIYPNCPRLRRPIINPIKDLEKNGEMIDTTDDITEYTDSTTFLKGTQSDNPHNDYCQHFVDTGERPQNFIRDTGLKNRFEEYPKLRELIRLKDEQIANTATPPMYLKTDLATFDLRDLQCKFDVILIEPPLEEYTRSCGVVYDRCWSWDDIENLEIDQIAAQRSFIWVWCGSGEGLDKARKCIRKWGFRRCEDICWIKTNRDRPGHSNLESGAVFQRTKEHCLMGIKGTVRRSTDADFIHANVDIDLIIDEEIPGVKDKPVEMFHFIEHFCLGRRRLHIFGRDTTIREGWLTVGPELTASNFDARIYSSYFTKDPNGTLTGSTEEIERLRPKSPPPRQKPGQQGNTNPGGVSTSSGGMIQPGDHMSNNPNMLGSNPDMSGAYPSSQSTSMGHAMPPNSMPLGGALNPYHHSHHNPMNMSLLSMLPYSLLSHPGSTPLPPHHPVYAPDSSYYPSFMSPAMPSGLTNMWEALGANCGLGGMGESRSASGRHMGGPSGSTRRDWQR